MDRKVADTAIKGMQMHLIHMTDFIRRTAKKTLKCDVSVDPTRQRPISL